ncbi:hypothetical protein JCM33374_g2157 [Metschnikowia sp. JCM 33374]|nr:hypothetical protein JCM33374_g2157 [Metschnikowia sp. JCM 33374]
MPSKPLKQAETSRRVVVKAEIMADEPSAPNSKRLKLVGNTSSIQRNELVSSDSEPQIYSRTFERLLESLRTGRESRWDHLRTFFLDSYHPTIQTQINQVFSGMSENERLNLLVNKTARATHEVILRPFDGRVCTLADVEEIKAMIGILAENAKKSISLLENPIAITRRRLCRFRSFSPDRPPQEPEPDVAGGKEDKQKLPSLEENTKMWRDCAKKLRGFVTKFLMERLKLFQLLNFTVRLEPVTNSIHVTPKVWYTGAPESPSIPRTLLDIPMLEPFKPEGTQESKITAVDRQMEVFESSLQVLHVKHSDNVIRVFESLHNNLDYELFEFRFPFDEYPPFVCTTILQEHHISEITDFHIVSEPFVSLPPSSHHVAKVYIRVTHKMPILYSAVYTSTLTRIEEGKYCSNCFADDHGRENCKQPSLGIGRPKGVGESDLGV